MRISEEWWNLDLGLETGSRLWSRETDLKTAQATMVTRVLEGSRRC
jgi:hypothetical protein